MNEEVTLRKAINKAMHNGFRFSQIWGAVEDEWTWQIYGGDRDIVFFSDSISPNPWRMNYETLIFNQDFAKALWGEKVHRQPVTRSGEETEFVLQAPAYLWHLQQMVVADNPLEYLGEHL